MSGVTPSRVSSRVHRARYIFLAAVAMAFVGSMAASAGTPHLVLDINTQTTPVSTNPVPLGKLGNELYFIAQLGPGMGAALFKTDGTSAGTAEVKPIHGFGVLPGGPSPYAPPPPLFISAVSKAYFLAYESATGQEVWVTDGTAAGTHIVADIYPGPNGNPQLLGLIGTDLIFAESQSATTWQIFRTDGTASGTRAVSNFAPSLYGQVNESVVVDGKVFMAVQSATICCQPDLWVTDGTPSGTSQIDADEGYPWHLQPSSLRAFGDSVMMLTDTENHGVELTRVDAATNTLTILETVPGPGSGAAYGSTIAAMDGFVLFLSGNPNDGLHLWRSDGTLAGTTLVMDMGPGVQFSSLSQNIKVTRVGSRAVFLSENAQNGPQLWGSDGTAQGTVPLIATPDAPQGGFVEPLVNVAGTHGYYAVYTGSDFRLVVTDGTVAGTQVLTNAGPIDPNGVTATYAVGDDNLVFINTYFGDPSTGDFEHLSTYGPPSGTLTALRNAPSGDASLPVFDGGHLLFDSDDPVNGDAPWFSDGTPSGTHLIENGPGVPDNDSEPSFLTDVGGTLMFVANDGVHGAELWKSDGTANGTTLAFNLAPAASSPTNLVAWNGDLYFFAQSGYPGAFMRTTGGLSAVETLAPLAAPGPADLALGGCPDNTPLVFNGRLWFSANDGSTGFELWSSDGTSAGTTRLADLNPDLGSSFPCELTSFNGRLYFRANAVSQNAQDAQLWSTDGTTSGTTQLTAAPYSSLAPETHMIVFNGALYFVAADSQGNLGTYQTDGTSPGTQLLNSSTPYVGDPIGVVNGRLTLLKAVTPPSPATPYLELWFSDGTPAGTAAISGVQIPTTAPVLATGTMFYFVSSGSDGIQPWVSDGTAAGTHELANLNASGDSDVGWFANFRGVVYLAATDPADGARVFRTDGTTAGTVLVGASALPYGPAAVSGQNLFFAGWDNKAGLELNAVTNDPPTAADYSATSTSDAAVTINVIANDADSDGSIDPSSVKIVSAPAHGTATATQSGTIVYTPNPGYAGTDSFTYTVADNQGAVSNAATVNVTATAPPPPPPAPAPSSKGGGGAADPAFLLVLAALLVRRRLRSTAGSSRSMASSTR